MKTILRGAAIAAVKGVLCAAAVVPLLAGAAAYPDRPIQFVINFSAGGATDINGRLIAKYMSERLGQPLVVENRAGAAGAIGVNYVTHARPDGYLIGMSGLGPTVIHALLGRTLGFDPQRDLRPVAFLGSSSMAFVTRAGSPIRSVRDLLELARAQPGRLTYGTAGSGTPGHLAAAYLASMAGIEITQVPYKGDSDLLPDLMAGRIDFASVGMVSVFPLLQANKLAGIAITTKERLPSLPGLPTVAESGVPGYDAETWNLLVVPTGTDPAIGARLNEVVNGITGDPQFNARLLELGSTTRQMDPAQLRQFISSERAKWDKVIRDADIKME
ncbi:tripartite tricarboxylate transporter substrate binding protein [Bordetella sp. BOR01]|uniref:Bug family tripartite tricarboxylate transporter substrate binding protein n=1 Tax=Bordetella sp. BOR01 TaxID=2854779 RepID=UPI001C45FA8F|nr:tripartite tricarboxylate transporter substrate binding protein [Bordetella sp. BOR01]MBV7486538.1 tripartite tricarboxylate transporter substrate binding protein [Bordetella sp. BOR01]